MTVYKTLSILLFFVISTCSCYRILVIFPFQGQSHFNVFEPILKELARKGHQVDVISNFPLKEPFPNYTDIIRLPTAGVPASMNYETVSQKKEKEWITGYEKRLCQLLGHPEISKLIKNPPTNPPYDLLITQLVLGYQCFNAIGNLWNVPVASVVTTHLYPPMHGFIGNPLNLAISSNNLIAYKEKMNFWERLFNVVATFYSIHMYHQDARIQDQYIKKYLGHNMPSYREVERSVAMILSNSHYTYTGVKPTTPGLIEIGGINIKNDTTIISPSLKILLDESKDGFIFFSFGSMLVVESLPHEIMEKFYSVARRIFPTRIIIRVADPDKLPKNKPQNIFTYAWLPQQQLLKHPNIKAFVTHGGALGTQEAIYYNVPMICAPFFAEQYINCDILQIRNVSLTLKIDSASQKDFDHAFQEILTNPLYKNSVRQFSKLYWDRPQSPKDTAIYWIEYVARHGKNVLRSPAVDFTWWQNELLDVYSFLLVCAIAFLVAAIFAIQLVVVFIKRQVYLIRDMTYKKKIQ